jgi:hypothetical protein
VPLFSLSEEITIIDLKANPAGSLYRVECFVLLLLKEITTNNTDI